jgi:hypothetical protein
VEPSAIEREFAAALAEVPVYAKERAQLGSSASSRRARYAVVVKATDDTGNAATERLTRQDQVVAPASSSAFNRRRSASFARRIARAMTGAATAASPDGSPRLRRVIAVPPSPASSHV